MVIGILKRIANLVTLLSIMILSNQVHAENKITLIKQSPARIIIELQNGEPVSGIQFSINGRGNIRFTEVALGARAASQGWEFYQFKKDDSTWNVLMLSPVRNPFSAGKGTIAEVTFQQVEQPSTDTTVVFLSRTEIVNPQAQIMTLSTENLAWRNAEREGSGLFALGQNFPNPFNPSTTISYTLNQPANVRLVIYDVAGREIKHLVGQYQFPGQYSVTWTSADESGHRVPSGMYIARLQVENETAIRKMVLTK